MKNYYLLYCNIFKALRTVQYKKIKCDEGPFIVFFESLDLVWDAFSSFKQKFSAFHFVLILKILPIYVYKKI